jgi:hypothetical protein
MRKHTDQASVLKFLIMIVLDKILLNGQFKLEILFRININLRN